MASKAPMASPGLFNSPKSKPPCGNYHRYADQLTYVEQDVKWIALLHEIRKDALARTLRQQQHSNLIQSQQHSVSSTSDKTSA